MNVLFLFIIFVVIVFVIRLKKPLYLAMIAGILTTVLLFRVNPTDAGRVLVEQTLAWETLEMLLSFYLIILIQLMLEKRGRLIMARNAFDRLMRNPRVNTMVSPAIMGLLPSAAVMTVCSEMVDNSCGEYMDNKTKTFVASYYRHIPEMFLPTFPVVLLALTLSNQNAGVFILAMIPMVLVACLIVYIIYLRKLPKTPNNQNGAMDKSVDKKAEIIALVKNLWTLIAVLLIIVVFDLSVCVAAPIVIVVNYFVDHFKVEELPNLLIKSAEPVLLGNMYLIMLFKGIVAFTGVLGELPAFFAQFPIPLMVSFAIIFFIGTVISGSQAIIALCLPMALAAFPNGGLPLLVMLMSVVWAAMQISPTHVCAFVAAEYYHTTINDVMAKGIVSVVVFSVLAYGYSMLLALFIH